jgi:hypothetical protein
MSEVTKKGENRTNIYRVLFFVVLTAFAALSGFTYIDAASFGECKYNISKIVKSQDKRQAAVQRERLCGLGGGATTDVALLSSKFQLYFPSYLQPILSIEGRRDLAIEWIDPTHLVIQLPASVNAKTKINEIGGILISYK